MLGRIFLGRYETIRLLGEGGMGKVYLARQLDLGRNVVVKVMHEHIAADPKFLDRFEREFRVMARFQHPYAVSLYDASINDAQGPCIIMEYIKGITLDALLQRNGRLTPSRVGRLLGQLCEVLQAAYEEDIIHRDLKPANLMVIDPDTPYEKVKVMDFGLAKLLNPRSGMKQVTETNMEFAVGTPGYICPEQVRGEETDHRGDIYSVGVILYEMLTGRLPFTGGSTMDILLAHATESPPTFLEIGATDWAPPAIEEVVRACLEKDPARRPQSARDLSERYETALAHQEHVLAEELPPNHPRARAMQPAEVASAAAGGPASSPAIPIESVDPKAVVHYLEAWMPERIAVYKLRGFVQDFGGDLVESVPGRIRVRLRGGGGPLSWLGLSRSGQIDVELRLQQLDPTKANQLHITVILHVIGHNANADPYLRARCDQVFVDLRAYLIGSSNSTS
jgi:serine/threonine-protein kinase